MVEDIEVVRAKDPAPRGHLEVLMYPHIHALWTYRVAHYLYQRNHIFLSRALSMAGRWASGIDIHPGAVIGRRFFIDHGAAVVIGETVRIGDDVMLYHQVTLGSIGWWRDLRRDPGARRHPVLEDSIVVGTNASVLGPITIGARSQIGAHAVITESVPPDSKVIAPTQSHITSPARPQDGRPAEPDGNGDAADLVRTI